MQFTTSLIVADLPSQVISRHWLQFKGYEPTTLRLNALERLGARVTAGKVAFDDHPNDKRFSDRIDTTTVDSVFAWMQRARLGKPVVEIKL